MTDETVTDGATTTADAAPTDTTTTAAEWLAGFAEVIGAPAPGDEVTEALLDLAGVAAHDSERMAAPIACWMAGIAAIEPAEALERARNYAVARAG